jgi:glycosyltransferase involved in cell wall biosynthesis
MKKKKRNGSLQNRQAEKKLKKLPLQLSACMIVKNEEEMLPRCLASIKDHVDELVIVDTGSTDRTVEIAESFGARVYHHPWQNDFSLHRNQSISYARGKWIFIIDADEEFVPSEQRTLQDELALAEQKGCDALVMRVRNFASGGTEEVCADSLRIFRNTSTIRYEGIVHNNLAGCTRSGISMGSILHYGYDQGTDMARKKFERTAMLLRKQIAEDPDNPLPHMYLACSHESLEQHREALAEALIAVDLVELREITEITYLRAYYTAMRSLILEKRFDEALELCVKSETRFGDQVDSLAARTMIHFETSDWAGVIEAGKRYQRALELYRNRQDKPSLVNVASFMDEWKILGWMGISQVRLGKIEDAKEMFSRSLEISPKPESVCGRAGLALATTGHLDLARYYLEEARRISGGLKDSRAVEALFKIAVLGKDESLAKRSIEDAFSYAETPGDWNRWLLDLANFALNHGDVRSALMMLAGIVASDEYNLPARLKLAHILVFHDMIEQAVTHCDGLLRILDLPRNQTLESLSDLADLFLKIGDELDSRGEPNLAAISRDIQQQLQQPAQAPGRQLQ